MFSYESAVRGRHYAPGDRSSGFSQKRPAVDLRRVAHYFLQRRNRIRHAMWDCRFRRQGSKLQTKLLLISSYTLSPFGTSGSARKRTPVASKIALAIAGASPIIGHSPAPTDGISLRSSRTVSRAGTSLNRGTRYCDSLPFRILPFSNSMASNSAPPILERSILQFDCAAHRDSRSLRTQMQKLRAPLSRRPTCGRH